MIEKRYCKDCKDYKTIFHFTRDKSKSSGFGKCRVYVKAKNKRRLERFVEKI